MIRGFSLHIGLNRIDPRHYSGWDGALLAAEFDALDMEELARSRGFETKTLLTGEATASEIIGAIEHAADELVARDIFLLSYAGHGGQVPDLNDEEADRADETWLAYDRQLVDDELYACWRRFRSGVRVVVFSDCCHGGAVTNARTLDGELSPGVATQQIAAAQSPRFRSMPRDVMVATYRGNRRLYDGIQDALPSLDPGEVSATMLALLGCQDDQLAHDGFVNGLFTENVLAAWDGGAWSGGYAAFHSAIRSRMPASQQPNLKPIGARSQDFERQTPFTVG